MIYIYIYIYVVVDFFFYPPILRLVLVPAAHLAMSSLPFARTSADGIRMTLRVGRAAQPYAALCLQSDSGERRWESEAATYRCLILRRHLLAPGLASLVKPL